MAIMGIPLMLCQDHRKAVLLIVERVQLCLSDVLAILDQCQVTLAV